MPNPLRIPTWLLGITAVVIPGAVVRVVQTHGVAAIAGFFPGVLSPLAFITCFVLVADRVEANGQGLSLWPGPKHRRILFMTGIVVTDIVCALALLLGGRFIAAFGI